jgi:hypothetical protein
VRTSYWVPSGLRLLDPLQIGLPDLGDTEVDIHYFADALSPDLLEMVKHMERLVLLHPNGINPGRGDFEPARAA